MSDNFKIAFEMYSVLNEHFKPLKVACDFGPDGAGGWWAGTKSHSTIVRWKPDCSVDIEHGGQVTACTGPDSAIEWLKENLK